MATPTCSRCDRPPRPGQRYCADCHAAYMRAYNHQPAATARKRARRVAYSAKQQGYLTPAPCAVCGCPTVEMHHPDYAKPLEVVWLCRPHHRALHRTK